MGERDRVVFYLYCPMSPQDVSGGGRPFVYQEVIDQGGEPIKGEQYFGTGRITNFRFGQEIAKVFRYLIVVTLHVPIFVFVFDLPAVAC